MPEPIWCWCVLKLTAQLTKNKTKPFGCLQELSGEDTDQIFAHSFLVLPSAVILQIIIKYDDSSKKKQVLKVMQHVNFIQYTILLWCVISKWNFKKCLKKKKEGKYTETSWN